ncbi:MAG: beta-ketoacyl synthase chain length factor [Haliea sp.]|nr:beta-ketoacyl synthase chain length factor [Haliea sp.]
MKITVERWCSWEIRDGLLPLCSRYYQGALSTEAIEKPALDNVPAIQRRRLGSLARTVFHVLDQCVEKSQDEPIIFSSVMGEIHRTQGILNSIAADEAVSPAAFSLSVHNGIGGLWSVIHGVKAPIIALAPPFNSPVPALLEAAGILNEGGYPAVNVVYYEENYPDFYAHFFESPDAPSALALRIIPTDDSPEKESRVFNLEQLPANPSAKRKWHSYAALLRILTRGSTAETVEEPQSAWELEVCR